MTAEKITDEYTSQIMERANGVNEANARYLVKELLREYAAKAYRAGRQDLAEEIKKII